MSAQSDYYLANAERLIGEAKATELKRLLAEQETSAMFTRADKARLDALIFELTTK